jgi:predicted ArsR family transcriptional regulator
MDGRAWTATELSTVAEVSASTTSGHLARLLSNGLVVCLAQGRHRYYRLAGPHIAALLENLMGVSMQAHKALTTSAGESSLRPHLLRSSGGRAGGEYL